jgi:hypothetical protein
VVKTAEVVGRKSRLWRDFPNVHNQTEEESDDKNKGYCVKLKRVLDQRTK